MISIQRLSARGANKNGDAVVDYLLATEYYTNGQGQKEENTRWGGRLAGDADLALEGQPVEKAAMLALAKGFSPSGKALCRNAGEMPHEVAKIGRDGKHKLDKNGKAMTKLEGGHRVGFDLTFTPPKPFCLPFAIAQGEERDAVLNAHRKAVDVAMGWLEDKVETRRGRAGKDVIATQGLIYMQADHLSSRNQDVNIHTHTLVFGVAKGVDGKWGTFDAQELYRHRVAADAIYKNELAMNMRELGYGISTERQLNADGKETGRVLYKVNGISDALCEKFSSRRQEILEYQEQHGVDAQTACLATRRHKDEPSYAEMDALWQRTLDAMPEGEVPTIAHLKALGDVRMQQKSEAEILERLHANEAVLCDHHLVDALGQEFAGQVRLPELLEKVEAFKQSQGLVAIEAERLAEEDKGTTLARRHAETRYAAPWMVDWENEVVHRIESRKDETALKVPAPVVDAAIEAYEQRKGFTLSGEQRRAVEHLAHDSGGVAVLEGFAGTGKTTVSDCYSEAFKAQGFRMLGVCVSNAAAQKLEHESGMPCVSVAKMLSRLDKGRVELGAKDVLVVDEAGMIDTNQTRQLLAHAQQAGAKVILQGDENQLQPIGAGSGLTLAKRAVDGAKLTEIRRQKSQEDRDLALLFYNRDEKGDFADLKKGTRSRRQSAEMGTRILAALDKKGALDDYDTQDQAIDAVVQDYLKSPVPADEKLVLGHSRLEVAALNRGIREGLKASGQVGAQDTVVRAKENGEWVELPLARGDRVRFTDTNEKLGVVNGSAGVVIGCRANTLKGGVDLQVRLQSPIAKDNGRVVVFNTEHFCHLGHNFATTIHKAQGASKQDVFHKVNSSMLDNHSALVAFSRLTSGSYRAYGTTEDIEGLKDRFGLERLKDTATGAGIQTPAQALVQAQAVRSEHEDKKAAKSALSDDERSVVKDAAQAFLQRLGVWREARREQGQDHGAGI
ncbi:MobF family relaxase [Arenimonas sp. MALMAid1274]|uniref:MobF family relaxase n=1 Tax=Arenimonas sp. MALMAid1274 TaxID=3411630 RepID=UPI003B9F2454